MERLCVKGRVLSALFCGWKGRVAGVVVVVVVVVPPDVPEEVRLKLINIL